MITRNPDRKITFCLDIPIKIGFLQVEKPPAYAQPKSDPILVWRHPRADLPHSVLQRRIPHDLDRSPRQRNEQLRAQLLPLLHVNDRVADDPYFFPLA